MAFAGVPGNVMALSFPSPAKHQPRPKAPEPPGKDTGMYIALLLRMKCLYYDLGCLHSSG